MRHKQFGWLSLLGLSLVLASCSKDDDGMMEMSSSSTITIENVLDSRPLVESGTFKNNGGSPLIMPGESISMQLYAGKGQAVSFATMLGDRTISNLLHAVTQVPVDFPLAKNI